MTASIDSAEHLAMRSRSGIRGPLISLVVTGGSTLVCSLLFPYFEVSNLIMVYLAGVSFVASRFGSREAFASSVLSVAAFDFFFVHPFLTFAVSDLQYVVTFGVMLAVGFLISSQTDRIRDQAALVGERELEIKREQLRNVLLSSVSHDIRTPLAVITGASSALCQRARELSPSSLELVHTVYEESKRLERLIRNVLDMTRLSAGAIELQKDWHSLEELMGSALGRTEALLGAREVTLEFSELPLISVDGLLIEQLLVNILENAARHTPEGTHIWVRAMVRDRRFIVVIEDDGPGIPSGEEARALARQRGRDGSSRGMGLGLAICQAIATVHGGSMEVCERQGGGASFVLTLPMEKDAPQVIDDQ